MSGREKAASKRGGKRQAAGCCQKHAIGIIKIGAEDPRL